MTLSLIWEALSRAVGPERIAKASFEARFLAPVRLDDLVTPVEQQDLARSLIARGVHQPDLLLGDPTADDAAAGRPDEHPLAAGVSAGARAVTGCDKSLIACGRRRLRPGAGVGLFRTQSAPPRARQRRGPTWPRTAENGRER